jgi:DNA-binding GntR family transcriptional regulator
MASKRQKTATGCPPPTAAPLRGATRRRAAAVQFAVPKLQRATLNDEVYEQLKQAIISGTILPGSTMTIRRLAASFGISLMPVREALRRLVAEHVLIMLPNRSAALPVITPERFHEITRIRVSLEALAAEEGAPRIGAAEIDRMAALNEAMERPLASRSPEYLKNNRDFHFTLYRASGLPTLVSMIESLWLQIGPLLTIHQREFTQPAPAMQVHHHAVLRALQRRDGKAAGAAIAADVQDAATIISPRL